MSFLYFNKSLTFDEIISLFDSFNPRKMRFVCPKMSHEEIKIKSFDEDSLSSTFFFLVSFKKKWHSHRHINSKQLQMNLFYFF